MPAALLSFADPIQDQLAQRCRQRPVIPPRFHGAVHLSVLIRPAAFVVAAVQIIFGAAGVRTVGVRLRGDAAVGD